MYKVVIAEKTENELWGIWKILEGKLKNVDLVQVLPYEQEILEYIKKNETAVIIMEVGNNGLNGIGMAREIRKMNEHIQIVLVSRLEYFALLKEAVRLRISSYLSAPFIEEEILEAVENALNYYIQINAEKYGQERQENILSEALKYAEYSFIYTALFSASFDMEYKNYKRLLNLSDYGYILNIEIERTERERPQDKKLYHYLKSIISEHGSCVVGPRIGERIVVFVGFEGSEERIEKRNTMDDVRMAAHIIIGMQEKFGLQVLIGIGGVKELLNIHVSYEEAVRCLRYRGKRNVVEIRDVEMEEISKEEYVRLEEEFLKCIRLGTADAIDLLNGIFDAIRPLQLESQRNKIFGLLVLADHEARSDSKSDLEYFPIIKTLQEAEDMNAAELERWAYNKVEIILNTARTNRIFRKSEGVKNALRYMEEHYMDPISLEDISQYIGISPQHFSKTFRDETGINYIDWLTRLRIENAKRFLLEEKSTVKEVCYMVGYNDPNYFSRIFKKIEGVSPTEYINEALPNNNS